MTAPLPDDTLDFILAREGGFVNDKDDPGGATNMGVTQGTYSAWLSSQGLPSRPVQDITSSEVWQIYEHRYWKPSKAGEFADTHPKLALAHMDAAVNHGLVQAAKFLQRAVGTTDDGKIGPITLSAVRASDEPRAISHYLMQRAAFYRMLVGKRPQSGKFLVGWLARLRHVARETGVCITPDFQREP